MTGLPWGLSAFEPQKVLPIPLWRRMGNFHLLRPGGMLIYTCSWFHAVNCSFSSFMWLRLDRRSFYVAPVNEKRLGLVNKSSETSFHATWLYVYVFHHLCQLLCSPPICFAYRLGKRSEGGLNWMEETRWSCKGVGNLILLLPDRFSKAQTTRISGSPDCTLAKVGVRQAHCWMEQAVSKPVICSWSHHPSWWDQYWFSMAREFCCHDAIKNCWKLFILLFWSNI